MPEPTACLQSFTEGIRALTGAGCVTLFVPAYASRGSQQVLCHCGTIEPIPELRDPDQAQSFLDHRASEASSTDSGDSISVLPSSNSDSGLIALPAVTVFGRAGWTSGSDNRRRRVDTDIRGTKAGAWLGIRLFPGAGSVSERLVGKDLPTEMGSGEASERWWNWLFFLGSALATHSTQVAALLRDPLTGLADRRQFQSVLAKQLEEARTEASCLTLILVNPDNFAAVNERSGHEVGDRCVNEISDRLRRVLRGSDLISRYGGVIFAAILAGTPEEDADKIAHRLWAQLTKTAFAGVDQRLEFSIGYRHVDFSRADAPIEPLELFRQADQALSAAKRSPGSSVQKWRKGSFIEEAGRVDRLAGIFTGDLPKDYRNMELLREIAKIIALHPDLPILAREVVEVLYSRLAVWRIGLFSLGEGGELRRQQGLTRSLTAMGRPGQKERLDLDAARHRLLSAALDQSETQCADLPVGKSDLDSAAREVHCYAIPLIAGNDNVGCLYLEGPGDSLRLDASDLIFFKDLASQVAVALDRARLAKAESERREAREQSLRAELRELRQTLSQVQLVYRSPVMKKLVATAQRAAATDATVLLTGSTGTGKEILARTIHQLSPRGDQPFVVVDCGAISSNLIETELFGHEKGAFTSAEARRTGRLESAGEGTVLLDEIGELPLEVQSRLLRFVQEKQFTRVGGTRVQQSGVRILAATNRDLGSEVAAGRFREDLYYRLRVIVLNVPPLRERRQDILPLAQHFLEIVRDHYEKPATLHLSDDAQDWLLEQDWPGNVRELKSQIVQAVLLSQGSVLTPADFGASPEATAGSRTETRELAAMTGDPPPSPGERGSQWQELRKATARLLDEAVAQGTILETPLLRALGEEVLLCAHSLVGGVGRQAAMLLDLPETSTRRRLEAASRHRQESIPPSTPSWRRVEQAIAALLDSGNREADLFRRFQDSFLRLALERFPSDARTGAALLGVSRRTFSKRVARLREGS